MRNWCTSTCQAGTGVSALNSALHERRIAWNDCGLRRRVQHRLEPARDAAIQRVVVPALIMRLVRLAPDPVRARLERRMPALPVAAAIGHVGVEPEIVPAARERVPIPQRRPPAAQPASPAPARTGTRSPCSCCGPILLRSRCLLLRSVCCRLHRRRRRFAPQDAVAGERALDRQLVEPLLDPPVQLPRHRPAAAGLRLDPHAA